MAENVLAVSTLCDHLLTAAIPETQADIAKFSVSFREARRDLSLITREIASLELTLQAVQHDASAITQSPGLDRQFRALLPKCRQVLEQIRALFRDISANRPRERASWSSIGRGAITELKTKLEKCRQALDLDLDLLNITALAADTESSDSLERLENASKDIISPISNENLGNSFKDDLVEDADPGKCIVSPIETEKPGNSLQDSQNGDTDSAQARRGEDVRLTAQTEYTVVLRSSFAPNPYSDVKRTEDPVSYLPSDYLGTQESLALKFKQLTRAYAPTDASEEKEVVISRPGTASTYQESRATYSTQLSETDLVDANEQLFNAFFVDKEAGRKVLTKYVPRGTIAGLLEKGADPDAYDVSNHQLQAMYGGTPKFQGPCGTDMSGTSILALAAITGDVNVMELLLKHGATIDKPRGQVGSPLNAAAIFNQQPSIQYLLDNGADPYRVEGRHNHPLITAVSYAGLEALRKMLRYRTSLKNKHEVLGMALHTAISDNHLGKSSEKVQVLLEGGANPNFDHESLGTPLLSAAYANSYTAAHVLLQANADPNVVHSRRGAPLLAAVHRGHISIATLLVENGANKGIHSWLEDHKPEGEPFDLLSAAISSRRPDVVKWVLQSGFGNREYWRSGAFNDALNKFSMHRNIKIYPMIYNRARREGYSMVRKKTRNPLVNAMNLRSYQDE